jgi:hypothetical protein
MKRLVLVSMVFVGCASEPPSDVCPTSYCNDHGTCREVAQLPQCECQPGYEGPTCAVCQAGTHVVGNDCVADETCDDRCGANGQCVVTNGVAGCLCAIGYDGPTCRACNGGFVGTTDDAGTTCTLPERCNAASCAAGSTCDDSTGRIACSCSGPQCAQCSATLCGAYGTCSEARGVVTCTCETGHQGERCGSCVPGYASLDGGVCTPTEQCTASTCSGGGTCSASTGKALCTCTSGYSGLFCETCSTGFHRDARGECTADEVCSPTSCPTTASCEATGGVVSCRCLPGYAGTNCAQCYPGYHRESGECVLDRRCVAGSCGPAVCEDGTGSVVCLGPDGGVGCPSGFSGAFCEVEVLGCGTACNTGTCVRVGTGTQCLCTDGRYGSTCLPGPTISSVSPSAVSIRGGTPITLRGTGFVAGSTLTVGGLSATGVSFVSATEYRAVVPAAVSVGTKALSLRAPNNQVGTSTILVTPAAFTFDGGLQSFTVPAGVSRVSVQAWGGGGGAGRGATVRGGAGGFASATLDVDAGEVLLVVVGGGGSSISGAALPDGGATPACGAGGGLSGLFRPMPDGGVSAVNAVLIAGGGGGGAFFTGGAVVATGGNGGGPFGAAGALATGGPVDSQGAGGSPQAGGVGGCVNGLLCGQTGLPLQGGGGGVMSVATPRVGATFGGGGGVGLVNGFCSAGGGGGFFGGGGGANGEALGGGGGSGFVAATGVRDDVLQRSATVGVPSGLASPGYLEPSGYGGRAQTVPANSGGPGLVLIGW